jgi:heme/copper-type cytochrome/quinol oxidase subunit 2
LPIWQINPSEEKRHLNMLNLDSLMPNAFAFSNASETPLFGFILDDYAANYVSDAGKNSRDTSTPRSFTVLPILNPARADLVLGITGAEIEWITLLDDVVPDAPTVCIVLENTCGQVHTYLVRKGIASYLGNGDKHDAAFDQMAKTVSVTKAMQNLYQHVVTAHPAGSAATTDFEEMTHDDERDGGFCIYTITVYPTAEYEQSFHTGIAFTYTLTTIVLAVTSIFLFVVYSILVDRRQKRVLDSAAKSNAIIKSLFPAVVRRRLFGPAIPYKKTIESYDNVNDNNNHTLISNPLRRGRGRRRRRLHMATQQRHANNPKTRLTNFLTSTSPNDVYSMEHQDDEPIAEMFSNTTVVRIHSSDHNLKGKYPCHYVLSVF